MTQTFAQMARERADWCAKSGFDRYEFITEVAPELASRLERAIKYLRNVSARDQRCLYEYLDDWKTDAEMLADELEAIPEKSEGA